MKKLKFMLLLAAPISFVATAQNVSFGNFKVVEQEIIYQQVFQQDSITPAALEKYYAAQTFVTNVAARADGVDFEITDLIVDYKKFQFSQVGTPLIIQTGKYSGKVSVGVREGKYRVTMKAIQFTGNIGYKTISSRENMTNYATIKSATELSQTWCTPSMLGLLDKAFTDKVQFKKGKDDW